MTNVNGKDAAGIVGNSMMAGYLPDFDDAPEAQAKPKAKRKAKAKPVAKVEAKPVVHGLPVHIGTKADSLNMIRGQVLDLLEANGFLVASGPDALFFAQGFEDLVKAHFGERVKREEV